jgi:LL-diaminopimelate aminotransferase
VRTARRIDALPPYLFAELDRKIAKARDAGVDVISFAIGDPDRPTPAHIVGAARKAMSDPSNHRYPSYYGLKEFREAIASHYQTRFGVTLDPDTQVLPLIGSKEGIANLATAFVDPGDAVLVSDPGYPVYATSTMLAGGTPISVPIRPGTNYLPDFDAVAAEDVSRSKVAWTNYPNNPTAAVCDLAFHTRAVEWAAGKDLLLAHDAAYIELTYDGYKAPSVLEAPGALDVAIEFGSLSKTFNMTGWRVGWVVGAAQAIEALGRVKTNIDSGIFNALQKAGIAALQGSKDSVWETAQIYRRRRDSVVDALNSAGWKLTAPRGAIYIWAPVPEGETSVSFCEFLLEAAGVVTAPGSGYGSNGEGYIRFSLTIGEDRLEEGMNRVAKAMAGRR